MSEVEPNANRAVATFLSVLGLAVALLALLCLRVAWGEWFVSDDFATLNELRTGRLARWWDAYLPLEPRARWFYRPLGVYSWYGVNLSLFGLDAGPWFAQTVLVHFATGGLVFAIARSLGFSTAMAGLAAALSVTRPVGLERLYYGAVFAYVAAVFLSALALWCWLEATRREGARLRAGACAAFAAALLCHESAIVFAAILPLSALASRRLGGRPLDLGTEVRQTLPLAAIAAGYLVVRFGVIADSTMPRPYDPAFGMNLVANYVRYWEILAWPAGALALLAGAITAGMTVARGKGGDDALGWWLVVSGFCLAWISLALLPFLAQYVPNARYLLFVEVPASLLLAGQLEIVWRGFGRTRAAPLLAALAVLALASMPFARTAARAQAPESPSPDRFLALIEEALPRLGERGKIAVLFGGEGLARPDEAMRFEKIHYGRTVAVRMLFPERQLRVRMHDLALSPDSVVVAEDTLRLALQPGMQIAPADARVLRALYERGAQSTEMRARKRSREALEALAAQGDDDGATRPVNPSSG